VVSDPSHVGVASEPKLAKFPVDRHLRILVTMIRRGARRLSSLAMRVNTPHNHPSKQHTAISDTVGIRVFGPYLSLSASDNEQPSQTTLFNPS
jgi:hypothetical protein